MTGRPILTPLRAYLATQATWFFAFGVQTVLFPFIVLRVVAATDAELGLAQSALTAPSLFLLLLGGVIAERRDKRNLLVLLHAAAIAPALILAIVLLFGAPSLGLLIGYALVMGTIGAIMMPTRDAALNAVLRHQPSVPLQRAVVITSLVQFLGQIAGMAAAGSAALLGVGLEVAPLALAQAAALAIGGLAAAALPVLAPAPREGDQPAPATVLRQLAEGLGIVWRNKVIRSMCLTMVAVGVFVIGGGFMVLLPLLVKRIYDGALAEMGLVFLVFWAGAAMATAALSRFQDITRPGRVLTLTFVVGAGSLLTFVFSAPFELMLVVVAIWGAASGVGIAMSRAIVQTGAPLHAMARVLSVYQLGFMGGAPIGAAMMGLVTEAFGIRAGAAVLMLAVLCVAAWLGFASPIGKLRSDDRAS